MIQLVLCGFSLLPCFTTTAIEDPERLARALEAIVASNLESDLYFLADDAMGGRDTPSPQLMVAAKFISMRLQRLGFSSALGETARAPEDWYHSYPIYRQGFDGDASKLELRSKRGRKQLSFGEQYFLYRSTHAFHSSVEAPVVSAGWGSSEEIQATDCAGKWMLVFDPGTSFARIQREATKAGALGLMLAETEKSKEDYGDEYKKIAERALKGVTTNQALEASDKRESGLPMLLLSRQGLRELLEASALVNDNLHVAAGQELGLVAEETRLGKSQVIQVPNVAGFWPGRDVELSKEVIIVSAHFDHVGMARGETFNGADDNASGSSGLLGIAEALVAYGPMRRSVLLLWVSGEEKGLWGSEAWTLAPVLPEGCHAVANLNIDMIGRTAEDELYVTPTANHPSYNAIASAAYAMAKLEGFPKLRGQDEFWERSDHYNFDQNLKIPVAFLSAGQHPDYHKPSDTPEKIDFEKLGRVTRTIMRLLDHIEDGLLN